jgi:hypothetical protein
MSDGHRLAPSIFFTEGATNAFLIERALHLRTQVVGKFPSLRTASQLHEGANAKYVCL